MDKSQSVNLTYGSVELIGRELKRSRGRGRGELPIPRRRRHAGGGGGAGNARSFLVVTDAAGASTYDVNGITGGTVGKGYLLDEDMQKESSDSADKVEFKSLHFVGVPVGAIVEVSSEDEIVAGTTWDGAGDTTINKVWGEIISAPHELYQLTGAGEEKVLFLPTSADEPQDMVWAGEECVE